MGVVIIEKIGDGKEDPGGTEQLTEKAWG